MVVPVTVEENCWLVPVVTDAPVGLTVTAIGAGATMVTLAVADFVGCPCVIALTETVAGVGAVAGAV